MEIIRDFKNLNKSDNSLAGGKGASLGEMTQAGISIPPGFVILSTAFENFLKETNSNVEIEAILGSVNHEEIHTVENASEKIKALILGAEMPKTIAEEIQKFFKELNTKYVAVRSSATAEDSENATWAGQLESYLNTTEGNLLENVKKCWASLFTQRAVFYRFEKKLHKQKISIAVVVQKMVDSEVSGVAFSVDPVTQDRDQLVIEAAFGLGEAVVLGAINPDRYEISKKLDVHIIKKTINKQEKAIKYVEGKNVWENLPQNIAEKQKLSDQDIIILARIVMQIEEHSNMPVDVEWAKDKNRIYIVQSRPITTLVSKNKDPNYLWSNFNIAEILPGVNPPMVTSVALKMFVPVLGELLGIPKDIPLARSIKGRLYFNLTVFELGLRKIIKTDNFSITNFFGGTQNNKEVLMDVSLRGKINLLFFGFKISLYSLFLNRVFRKKTNEIKQKTESFNICISKAEKLNELIVLENTIISYITSFIGKEMKTLLYRLSSYFIFTSLCQKWLLDKNNQKAHILLASGSSDLQLIEVFEALWRLSRKIKNNQTIVEEFKKSVHVSEAEQILRRAPDVYSDYKEFLKKYGYRAVNEVNFSLPRWQENPAFIFTMLKNYLEAPADNNPQLKLEVIGQKQILLLDQISKQLPRWKFFFIKKLLTVARKAQHEREFVKSELVRLFASLRAVYLKIGNLLYAKGLLENSADVFMLEIEEITKINLAMSEFEKDLFKLRLSEKKQEYATYSNIRLPDTITDLENISESIPLANNSLSVLRGISASSGKVLGSARVIKSIEEITRLKSGDILVTDHTDPGWTPVFVIIKGVITNTGGLLSHASIIAREYGLPAIVNVAHATELIKDGDLLEIDADNGVIRILK